jgi:hypothetical protein
MTASVAPALAPRVETSADTTRETLVAGTQGAVDIKKFVTTS